MQDDGVEAAKAAAERALLSSIPEHVMKELRAHAAQAKLEAEQLNVSSHNSPLTGPQYKNLGPQALLLGIQHSFPTRRCPCLCCVATVTVPGVPTLTGSRAMRLGYR